MRTDQNITWRVFATWRLSIAVLVFEVASLITSDQLASLGVTPYLTLPVLIAAFFVRRVDHWIFTALWSAVGLLAAQAMMYLLAVGSQHTILDTTRSLSTDLSLIGFQVTSGLVLVAGIALLGKYAASVSYDEAGVLCSIELESIFGWRSSTFFAALSIYAYLMRSLEVAVSASLLDTTIKAWTLMQSDILAVFILLPAIIGAVLSLAGAPRLEPDLKPFWVIIICYIAFVGLATWLGLSFGSLFSVVSISVAYGVLAILSTLAPTMQWSGRLLLINLAGFITVSLHNGILVTELFAVTSGMSFLVLTVMTLRLIAQINMNRANARTELYLRAGTGAFAIMSEEHEFLYVSEQFIKMTEYESLEALPHIRQMIVDLSSEEHAKLHARVRAVETGVLRLPTRSNTLKTKSGREIKVERSIRWFEIPGEEKRRLSVSYVDVTDKARLEVERADQEEVLNAFVYDGPQYCFVEDEEFKIRLISEGAAELIAGKSSAELIGKDPLEYFGLDDQKRIMAARSKRDERLERGETVVSDTPLTFKRGEDIVKVRIQVKLLHLPSGAVMRGIIFDDITKIEQARQRAENYLNAGTSLFFIRNEDFELEFVSEPLISRLGYENFAEVQPSKHWRYDPTKVSAAREFYMSKPLNETFRLPDITEIRTKQGDKLSFIETFKWFEDPFRQHRLLMTSYEDVTDTEENRQNAIKLLNQANAYLQNGVNAYVINDTEFRNIFVSEEFTSLTGYDEQSFSTAENFYLNFENRDRILQRPPTDESVMGERIDLGICGIRCKDGSEKTVRRFSRLFQGPDENNLILIAFDDITEVEQARQQAEDYLKAGTGSFLIQNELFETLYVSEKVFEFVSKESVYAINAGDVGQRLKSFPSFDNDYWIAHRRDIEKLKVGELWESSAPEHLITPSGDDRYIIRRRRWFASNEERLLYTELQDVTEINRALEIANTFLDSQLTAFSIQNEDFSFYYISDEFKQIFNIETVEEIGDPAKGFWENRDEAYVTKDREKLLSLPTGEISDELEPFVYVQASGEKLSFKVKSKWILNPAGEGRLLITSFGDVTSLENALQEAQTFLEGNVNAYVVQDESWQYVYASEQFLKLIGVQDISSIPEAEVLFPDVDRSEILKIREDWSETEFGDLIETPKILPMRCPSGELKQVKRSARKIKRKSGEGFLTVVGYEDQTELQRALSAANTFLESQMTAFVIQNEDFSYYYVSNEFLRLCDVSNAEEIADPTKGFWANKDEAEMSTNRKRLSALPTGHINEEIEPFIFVKSSGARLSLMVKSKWILNPAGEGRLLITAFEDVTAIEEQRAQLDHLKKTAELYLEAGINAYGIQNENFEHLYLSKEFINLTGYTVDTMPNHEEFYPEFDEIKAKSRREKLVKTPNGKIVHSGTHKVRTKDGNTLWLSRSSCWFKGISGERLLMVSFEDHTALTQEREFTQSLIERSSALIVTQTKDGAIHSVSQAFVDLMGYERDALIGKDLIDFCHPEDQAAGSVAREKFQEVRQQEITIERRLIDANNQTKTFILNARASNVSAVYESILTLSDITALKAAEEKLRHLVERDELTGIYSRRGMKHRFGSDQRSEDLGLYLIDLDHFKLVNDAYGHDAGDMLLIATANVLESQTRSEGSCFRLGGEEFALMRPWRGWKDAYDFSENLRELIGATSIESGGRSVQRTASIGVSYLLQNASMSEALKLADIVLREAKERGRNCCVLADEETLADFEARGVFIQASEVQLALERGEMEYFVQPIVGGAENSTFGFEALIRWFLPSGELVGPMKFVDVLYQVIRQPRYAQLKLDLRRQVLEQLKDYPEQYVSFNFTLEQIGYLGGAKVLHRDIQSILDHANRQIVIELSEKALHARVNEDVLIEELSQLRAFGYKIALDDFGVESSNIQRLQNFPIDIVKIDRSLISEVTTSETTRKMVGSLAALLKSLELSVTVEGIETQEQAKIINDFGLTTHQGYYYSKPVPPVELLPRVAE